MLPEFIILANPKLGGASMNQRWTLHVKNFGKVKEADIEISPLMLFVGDNNSGKSYLMSLLWGILTVGRNLFYLNSSLKYQNNQAYKNCGIRRKHKSGCRNNKRCREIIYRMV